MLSLVVEGGGYSLVVERRPLIAVASLAVERGLSGLWASLVAAHGLSCFMACGILSDQGLNHIPPSLAGKFFTTELPGKSVLNVLLYTDLNSSNNFGYNSERLFTIYYSVVQGPAFRSVSGIFHASDNKVNYYLGSASTWRIYFQGPQAV